jgi:hypothetical protein
VLDDISGTALVSAFAWSQWHGDWAERLRERMGREARWTRMMTERGQRLLGPQGRQ